MIEVGKPHLWQRGGAHKCAIAVIPTGPAVQPVRALLNAVRPMVFAEAPVSFYVARGATKRVPHAKLKVIAANPSPAPWLGGGLAEGIACLTWRQEELAGICSTGTTVVLMRLGLELDGEALPDLTLEVTAVAGKGVCNNLP